MNKTAEIVSLWAKYEDEHPKADIAQFCQDYLLHYEHRSKKVSFWKSPVPPDDGSVLIKLLGRIAKLHYIYSVTSFRDCGIYGFDDFLYLNSIANIKHPKKTEIIHANFNELSSGLLIIDRLKKSKLITEQQDQEDKRTRRLRLTKKGETTLGICYQKLNEVNALCFSELSDEQVNLCIQILNPVESLLAKMWLKDKK